MLLKIGETISKLTGKKVTFYRPVLLIGQNNRTVKATRVNTFKETNPVAQTSSIAVLKHLQQTKKKRKGGRGGLIQ